LIVKLQNGGVENLEVPTGFYRVVLFGAKLVRETFVSLGEKDAQIAIFAEFEVQKVRSS
jgi:hypothetical protein